MKALRNTFAQTHEDINCNIWIIDGMTGPIITKTYGAPKLLANHNVLIRSLECPKDVIATLNKHCRFIHTHTHTHIAP